MNQKQNQMKYKYFQKVNVKINNALHSIHHDKFYLFH